MLNKYVQTDFVFARCHFSPCFSVPLCVCKNPCRSPLFPSQLLIRTPFQSLLSSSTCFRRFVPSRPSPDAGNLGSENSAGMPAIQDVNCCIRDDDSGRKSRTFRTYLRSRKGTVRLRFGKDNETYLVAGDSRILRALLVGVE